jgi:hypothetical protein
MVDTGHSDMKMGTGNFDLMVDTGYFYRIVGMVHYDRIMDTRHFDRTVDTEQCTVTSSALIEVRNESAFMVGSKMWRIKYGMVILK